MAREAGVVELAEPQKLRYHTRRVLTSIQDVTPEMAAAWLSDNPHNRPLDEARVAEYAERMRSGGWVERVKGGSRPIEVLDTGRLLNGQHRLTAVIRAGIPVRMWVEVYTKEIVGEASHGSHEV